MFEAVTPRSQLIVRSVTGSNVSLPIDKAVEMCTKNKISFYDDVLVFD